MRAIASSLGAWRSIERQEGVRHQHGLTFPLEIVHAIGRPHGLEMVAEEQTSEPVTAFDAVMIGVLDSRNLVDTATYFDRWRLPLSRHDRTSGPLVWAGGSGLYNPLPFADIADLIVLGDAEPSLPTLLNLWADHGNTDDFLDAAAAVPGVFVPSRHDPETDFLERGCATDITVTLNNHISVNLNGLRRIEIARGCKFSCRFCSLGWHAPLRENTAEAVAVEIRRSPGIVHLQAGDAESHSGIAHIRAALKEHGGFDTGWTGRLDTTQTSDEIIDANKRYAFGVEGLTWEARRFIGKGHLTDDRLVDDTVAFLSRLDDDTAKGRAAWHMIAGLPGEQPDDVFAFVDVLHRIDNQLRNTRNLSIHWQPFQPLPGTPMQWFGCGGGARRLMSLVESGTKSLRRLKIRQHAGRTDRMARLCTVLARSDHRAIAALSTRADADRAAAICGIDWRSLDPDVPLPWRFIEHGRRLERLLRHFRAMADKVTSRVVA